MNYCNVLRLITAIHPVWVWLHEARVVDFRARKILVAQDFGGHSGKHELLDNLTRTSFSITIVDNSGYTLFPLCISNHKRMQQRTPNTTTLVDWC
jgi:hypothetical protein